MDFVISSIVGIVAVAAVILIPGCAHSCKPPLTYTTAPDGRVVPYAPPLDIPGGFWIDGNGLTLSPATRDCWQAQIDAAVKAGEHGVSIAPCLDKKANSAKQGCAVHRSPRAICKETQKEGIR